MLNMADYISKHSSDKPSLAASRDSLIVLGLCNCKVLIQYIFISLLEEDHMLHMQLDW